MPVYTRNAEGLEICLADIRMEYDPTVLAPVGISDSALTLGYGWETPVITPGLVQVAISTIQAMTFHGAWTLLSAESDRSVTDAPS